MTILDFPVQKAANVTRTLRASVAAVASPFTGRQQVQDWGGEWWEYQIDMSVLRTVDGRSLSAFLAQLGGQRGRFLFRDPTIRNPASVGAPVVSGARQAGNALVTSGWDLARDRRNLLTYPEAFENAAWFKSNTTILANAITAPDGTLTADKLVENTATTGHYSERGFSRDATVETTFSVYLKAGERNDVYLNLYDWAATANNLNMRVNLSTGEIISSGAGGAGLLKHAAIEAVGDGWFRVSLGGIPGISTGATIRPRVAIIKSSTTYTGDGTSGIYIWGAQLEEGELTDYQPIPSPVMYAGDFISIGTGADTRLHQLTADVTPDNNGNATLQIVPRLRPSPADGAVIETANPAVLLRATGPVPTAIDAVHHYRVSLTAREAL